MSKVTPLEAFLALNSESGVAGKTKARLLYSGILTFAELGFHAASTRVIEAGAGVNRNLIAHHWGSKDAFWKACVDALVSAFSAELVLAEDQAANVDGLERFRYFVRAFVRASAKFPQVHCILLDEGKRDEERLKWIVAKHVKPLKSRVEKLFRQAQKMGAAPDMDFSSFYYTLTGSVAIFAMASECKEMFDIDPFGSKQLARHADGVARLLIPEPRVTSIKKGGGHGKSSRSSG